MGTHTVHRTSVPATRTSADQGRVLFTVVGGAALVVAAFLNWSRDMTGVSLSNHSLINTEFLTQTDIVRTVGGLAVVIGLAGMFGLVDRSGWLTRLFGLLGIALFVMFLIEVLRSNNHMMQPGAWLALAGGVVMLIGGFLPGYGHEIVGEPMVYEERRVDPDPTYEERRADPVDPGYEERRMNPVDPGGPRRTVDPRGLDTDAE
jgi:hypothetical protein